MAIPSHQYCWYCQVSTVVATWWYRHVSTVAGTWQCPPRQHPREAGPCSVLLLKSSQDKNSELTNPEDHGRVDEVDAPHGLREVGRAHVEDFLNGLQPPTTGLVL
eukprot:1480809-Rhodomonas_salina.1